jgi:hypothetical protein
LDLEILFPFIGNNSSQIMKSSLAIEWKKEWHIDINTYPGEQNRETMSAHYSEGGDDKVPIRCLSIIDNRAVPDGGLKVHVLFNLFEVFIAIRPSDGIIESIHLSDMSVRDWSDDEVGEDLHSVWHHTKRWVSIKWEEVEVDWVTSARVSQIRASLADSEWRGVEMTETCPVEQWTFTAASLPQVMFT